MSESIESQIGTYTSNEEQDELVDVFTKSKREGFKKLLDNWFSDAFDQHYNWLEDNSPFNLSQEASSRSVKFIERILSGDLKAAESLFSAGDESRYNDSEPWSRVIWGKLHETDAITMRRKLVEAYPELLQTERILDLESQVKSLHSQINKANARLNSHNLGEIT